MKLRGCEKLALGLIILLEKRFVQTICTRVKDGGEEGKEVKT